MNIKSATISFNEQGTPVADAFDDVYFSNASGIEESQYVFLANNQLPERWSLTAQDDFVIAETGFGTGLNFLATWAAFERFKQQHPDSQVKRLYFLSVEKFPLQKDDLQQALAQWPQLAKYAKQLINQYPILVAGCHRLCFDDVILDLYLGDVQSLLPQWYCPASGLVDAWYLDGFAPSKNPQMWTDKLFKQMARLAKTGGTFATFTAAGFVKRGLASAGFKVEKRPGFGRKRDMLAGQIEKQPKETSPRLYHRRASNTKNKHVTIIGAGLAGANLAYSLAQRGYQIELYHQGPEVADGASGNPIGGFYPMLNADANISSLIYAQSFIFARQRYTKLAADGFDFAHQFNGAIQLAFNQQMEVRYDKLLKSQIWPQDLIRGLSQQQVEQMAGIPLPYSGLSIDKGGWLVPPELVRALLAASADKSTLQVHPQKMLKKLTRHKDNWQLDWTDGSQSEAGTVILALGHQSLEIEQLSKFPLRMVRGQVEKIASQAPYGDLKTLLCHKGYFTPAYQGLHTIGSTYVKEDTKTDYRESEKQLNLATQAKALQRCDWAQQLATSGKGRAAVRCTSPDHLPLLGAVPDLDAQKQQFADLYKALPEDHYPIAKDLPELFMLTGLGSRGLVTAPLMAEVIACQLSGEPLPLASNLLAAINPNRFLLRQLIRRQA